MNLFRIAQEALANVREHAQATTVTVTLLERDGGFAMRVTDDGCGFEPGLTAPGTAGAGFASMRSRSGLSGGSLRVGHGGRARHDGRSVAPAATGHVTRMRARVNSCPIRVDIRA